MLLFGLSDSAAEGSIQSTQMKLKRARLADDLNEKIALRPGPLELVEKNIIPVDSAVKEAIKGSDRNVFVVCVRGVGQGLLRGRGGTTVTAGSDQPGCKSRSYCLNFIIFTVTSPAHHSL